MISNNDKDEKILKLEIKKLKLLKELEIIKRGYLPRLPDYKISNIKFNNLDIHSNDIKK